MRVKNDERHGKGVLRSVFLKLGLSYGRSHSEREPGSKNLVSITVSFSQNIFYIVSRITPRLALVVLPWSPFTDLLTHALDTPAINKCGWNWMLIRSNQLSWYYISFALYFSSNTAYIHENKQTKIKFRQEIRLLIFSHQTREVFPWRHDNNFFFHKLHVGTWGLL